MLLRSFAGAVSIGFMLVALAQADSWHVSSSSVQEGGWTFRGLKREVSPGSWSYDVVVALASSGEAYGNNLVAVIYERPTSVGTVWNSKSWSSTDAAAVLKELKTIYVWPNDEDARWELGDIASAQGSPGPVKEFEKGLLSDSFLASIAEAAQSDLVAETAKNLGWEAASIGFDKWENGDDCTQPATLESYARAFAMGDATPDSEASSAVMLSHRADAGLLCRIRDWWCISVTVGEPYPAPDYQLQCGDVERYEIEPWTETTRDTVGNTTTVYHSGSTCFKQTCLGRDRRKKTVRDSCDGTTVTIIEERETVYTKTCCVSGNGISWGPNHTPPCTLGLATPVYPSPNEWLPIEYH